MLLPLHEARVKNDKDFQYLQEDIDEVRVQRKKNQVTLNEAARRAEQDAREARLKARAAQKNAGYGARPNTAGKGPAPGRDSAARDDGLQADERNLASLLAAEKARKDAKDVLLSEAVRILGDEVALRKSDARLVARMPPSPALMRD